jgi:hypothetical protein
MRKQLILLSIPLTCFFCCYLFISFFNRYASDDFEFLFRYQDLGITGAVKYFHESWNTRWTAILWLNIIFFIESKIHYIVWYHIISIAVLWFAFYRITKQLFKGDILQLLILSGFSTIAFFYSCFSISDVFFWVNTSTMYLWSVIALLFICSEVLSSGNRLWLVAICGLYIGGSYEPMVIVVIVGCLLGASAEFNKLVNEKELQQRMLMYGTILFFTVSAFIISLSGEGHLIRSSFLPQSSVLFKGWVLIKALIKIMLIHIPSRILPCLLFSFPWFLLGLLSPVKFTFHHLKIASITFLAVIILSLAPVVFIMSEMGPERAWTQVSLYLVIYCGIIAAYAGTSLKNRINPSKVSRVYLALALLFILATAIPQLIQSYKYSKAYDSRMTYLLKLKNSKRTAEVVLEPLPPVEWLHSAEISVDSNHFTNGHLRRFLALPFTIRLSSNPSKTLSLPKSPA